MTLPDKHTRVVDRLGKAALEYLSLEAAFQEIFDLKRKYVIETHARFVEHANADEPSDERVALEEALRILVVKLKKLTRSTSDLGEDERDTPNLAFVAEAVLAGELACGAGGQC